MTHLAYILHYHILSRLHYQNYTFADFQFEAEPQLINPVLLFLSNYPATNSGSCIFLLASNIKRAMYASLFTSTRKKRRLLINRTSSEWPNVSSRPSALISRASNSQTDGPKLYCKFHTSPETIFNTSGNSTVNFKSSLRISRVSTCTAAEVFRRVI